MTQEQKKLVALLVGSAAALGIGGLLAVAELGWWHKTARALGDQKFTYAEHRDLARIFRRMATLFKDDPVQHRVNLSVALKHEAEARKHRRAQPWLEA